jgi:hypothetical protein
VAVEKGDPVTIIHPAIATKGELVCERYYKAGFGGDDDAVSDMLVHRNPVRKEDGSYDFNVYYNLPTTSWPLRLATNIMLTL